MLSIGLDYFVVAVGDKRSLAHHRVSLLLIVSIFVVGMKVAGHVAKLHDALALFSIKGVIGQR